MRDTAERQMEGEGERPAAVTPPLTVSTAGHRPAVMNKVTNLSLIRWHCRIEEG